MPTRVIIYLVYLLHRGDQFRTVYANIAQLKSFIPTNTPFLALTATASSATKALISRSLRLNDPVVIAVSPNRPNIYYSLVRIPVRDVNVPFKWLLAELKDKTRLRQNDCVL